MATHVLWLPGFSPTSLNKLLGHWAQAQRAKQGDKALVAHYAREQQLPAAVLPRRVSLRIALAKGQRALDRDNAWKSLLDALVAAGLLVNDSPRWCREGTVEYYRHLAGGRETFVILEDLEP